MGRSIMTYTYEIPSAPTSSSIYPSTTISLLSAPTIRLSRKSAHNLEYVDSCDERFPDAAAAPTTYLERVPRRSRSIVLLNSDSTSCLHPPQSILRSTAWASDTARSSYSPPRTSSAQQLSSNGDDSFSEHTRVPFRSTTSLRSLLPLLSFAGYSFTTAQLICDTG